MIWLAYAAPIATFREFTAGYFRPTFACPPPSALYGMVLNIAGVETRGATDPPVFRIASAVRGVQGERHSLAGQVARDARMPGLAALYQHLHTVPVGDSGKDRKALTKGNKHHIAPAWRQILVGLRGLCVVDASDSLEARLVARVGGVEEPRYGLPFAGDNNFFLEELELLEPTGEEVDWLVVHEEMTATPRFRLTTWVEREGAMDTRQATFTTASGPADSPPLLAWVTVGGEGATRGRVPRQANSAT